MLSGLARFAISARRPADPVMAIPVRIPKSTLTMEEATILRWFKSPGEAVEHDEILFEMETDKVVIEVPAPAAGVLLGIDVTEGPARVGQTVAWIGFPGESLPERQHPPLRGGGSGVSETGLREASTGSHQVQQGTFAATPAARRAARELGISLAHVQGTGPGGRITEQDVHSAAQSQFGDANP